MAASEILEQGAPSRPWVRPLAIIAGLIIVAGFVAAEGLHAYEHRLDRARQLAASISVTTTAFSPGAAEGSTDETLANHSRADQDVLSARLVAPGLQFLAATVQREDGSRSVQVADTSGIVRFAEPLRLRAGRTLELGLQYRVNDCDLARSSRWLLALSVRADGHVVEQEIPAVSIDKGRSRGLVSCDR